MLFGRDVAKIEDWLADLVAVTEVQEHDAANTRLPYREPLAMSGASFEIPAISAATAARTTENLSAPIPPKTCRYHTSSGTIRTAPRAALVVKAA
jgi:hypothetical protein